MAFGLWAAESMGALTDEISFGFWRFGMWPFSLGNSRSLLGVCSNVVEGVVFSFTLSFLFDLFVRKSTPSNLVHLMSSDIFVITSPRGLASGAAQTSAD